MTEEEKKQVKARIAELEKKIEADREERERVKKALFPMILLLRDETELIKLTMELETAEDEEASEKE